MNRAAVGVEEFEDARERVVESAAGCHACVKIVGQVVSGTRRFGHTVLSAVRWLQII